MTMEANVMKAKVLKIPASGGWEFIEVEMAGGEVPLGFLQSAVGGWIECVGLFGTGMPELDIYLNEEGKLMGLPPNIVATRLSGIDRHGDLIVGDAVVCARSGQGKTKGLSASHETALRKLLDGSVA